MGGGLITSGIFTSGFITGIGIFISDYFIFIYFLIDDVKSSSSFNFLICEIKIHLVVGLSHSNNYTFPEKDFCKIRD